MRKIVSSAEIKGCLVPENIPDAEDANDLIVYCARVSNPSNQDNFATGDGLLRYCMKKKHVSIFNMANVVIEVNTPRDISRQILRHVSMHFQEFSQRYANVNELGFVTREARKQHPTNRQMSIPLTESPEDVLLAMRWAKAQKEVQDLVTKHYNWAIGNGIAKECARVILPEGNTMSRMYINATLRDWFFYCAVRLMDGVQQEHIDVANQCYELLVPRFPWFADAKEYFANE